MAGFKKIKFNGKRQKKSPKFFLKIVFLMILTAIILGGFSFYNFDFIKIKKVLVEGDFEVCATSDQIIKKSNLVGKNIFLIDVKVIPEVLRKNFLCLDKVEIKKILPGKIIINISQKEPVVAVKIVEVSKRRLDLREATASSEVGRLNISVDESSAVVIFLADKNGEVFKKVNQSGGLPTVFYLTFLKEKQELDRSFIKSTLMVLDKLAELSLGVKKSVIDGNKLLIETDGKIVFSLVDDVILQLASLQLIVQEAKINSRQIQMIDLSFDKPVVLYSPNK